MSYHLTGLDPSGQPVNVEITITPVTIQPPMVLNVRDHGARGDGLADDRAAIQAVLDGANAGQTVLFPAGDYKLSGTLLVRHSGVMLAGDGDTSRLLIGDRKSTRLNS